jgi:hypothetical protein
VNHITSLDVFNGLDIDRRGYDEETGNYKTRRNETNRNEAMIGRQINTASEPMRPQPNLIQLRAAGYRTDLMSVDTFLVGNRESIMLKRMDRIGPNDYDMEVVNDLGISNIN